MIDNLNQKRQSEDTQNGTVTTPPAPSSGKLHIRQNVILLDHMINALMIWMTPNLFDFYFSKVSKDKVKETLDRIRNEMQPTSDVGAVLEEPPVEQPSVRMEPDNELGVSESSKRSS